MRLPELRQHPRHRFLTLFFGLLLILTAPIAAQDAQTLESVTIAGTIQSQLGCPGDWQPECASTNLTYDPGDDLWRATFELEAGSYEYKAALNGTWDENYGAQAEPNGPDIALELSEAAAVTFYYDRKSNWVTDSVNSIIANVPGSFQAEIGCPEDRGAGGDWAPDCLRSWLQDPDGDGVYVYATSAIPPGSYAAKVAVNLSWNENYGDQGVAGGADISFTVMEENTVTEFRWDSSSKVMTITVSGLDMSQIKGNLFTAKAHWVTRDTILWDIGRIPGSTYRLHYDPNGAIALGSDGISGGESIELSFDREGVTDDIAARFPHLGDYDAFKIAPEDLDKVTAILKGQVAISAADGQGNLYDATLLQIPGVLDDLYRYDGPLGLILDDGTPTLHLWAPTALSVTLHLFDDSGPDTTSATFPMEADAVTGVWSITGETDWLNKFYLYEVEVFVPGSGQVERNIVTDPYSLSLAINSTRSQIVDLNDPALMPDGWSDTAKPPLAAPEDIVVYEVHVRDFSIFDESVPAEDRGKFAAFTHLDSNGMQHLRALAEAGLTHVHILPAFDIATINEDETQRQELDFDTLASFPPDSEEQQALTTELSGLDGFNWGYDPYHYTAPEGSYSTEADGSQRILEFRRMVQALNGIGLRVVMDVVYNHTNAAGQGEKSVLDRIVPGYYHRLNGDGKVETSTCCANTASEHNMMEKLMIDSLRTWAVDYRIDAFRFDLMGHHMLSNMQKVRAMLDALSLEADGVDGASIYVYGEGWNFGEVANDARGVNATQINLAGTGIGTFNDRLRDAVRGGSPFSAKQVQGFLTGLYYQPNGADQGIDEDPLAQLLLHMDQIRVGLTGNLRDYQFENAEGEIVSGADIDYNDQPAGYTLDPQENIVYISKHDNETLFDAIQLKAASEATMAERVRMNNLGLSIVLLSQGVPFFHAGDDVLRSKSFDRDSYNSGDWFNRLDFTYTSNNFGVGLPIAEKNRDQWELMAPLLANPELQASNADIMNAVLHFREMLQIRRSSPLFRLQTAEAVSNHLSFMNTGPEQTPGLIVMALSDENNLDPDHELIVVLFNALPQEVTFTDEALAGMNFELHPVQAGSNDAVVQASSYEAESGSFIVPGRTAAVFIVKQA